MLTKLTEAECRAAIRGGDFEESVRAAAPLVILALTQSWCPQWVRVRPFLEELASEEGVACAYVEYDREPFFDDFRSFKEGTFRNDQVPYLRYYKDGKLFKETNYVDRATLRRLVMPAP